MAGPDDRTEPQVRLRRFPMREMPLDPDGTTPDVERVFDQYGIRGFTYHTWGRWQGALPSGAGTTLRGGAGREETMEQGRRRDAPRAVSWEMPEDLKSGVLPLLRRMPDTAGLVARLKQGGPVVSVALEDEGLPDLMDSTQEVRSPATVAATAPTPPPTPAAPPAATQEEDARARLRRLALKGKTHG